MIVCVFSGVILTFHYIPFGNVFQNVEEISSLIPFGFFFRQLHLASGQMYVILLMLHLLDHFFRRSYRTYKAPRWIRLILPLGISFLLLFTGFILKGDKEGIYAGQICHHLLNGIPVAGHALADLAIPQGRRFFWYPFLYHSVVLPGAIFGLTYKHLRFSDTATFLFAAVILFFYAAVVPLPIDISPTEEIRTIKGPWFFLGIQLCLSTLHPLIAGIIVPFLFTGLWLVLPFLCERYQRWVHTLIIFMMAGYAVLCIGGHFFLEPGWSGHS